nr:helix-turn-helix domain-containing protein [Mitsuaria sp. WAJ17]
MGKDAAWSPFWEGVSVADALVGEDHVRFELIPSAGVVPRCGRCCEPVSAVHERVGRCIRDLPMLGLKFLLAVELLRLACPRCGQCLRHARWLDRHCRKSRRMAQTVADCCSHMPLKCVVEMFGLHWSTVRELDHRRLQAIVQALPPAQPTQLIMDEFALFKGHRYASVILDAEQRARSACGPGAQPSGGEAVLPDAGAAGLRTHPDRGHRHEQRLRFGGASLLHARPYRL